MKSSKSTIAGASISPSVLSELDIVTEIVVEFAGSGIRRKGRGRLLDLSPEVYCERESRRPRETRAEDDQAILVRHAFAVSIPRLAPDNGSASSSAQPKVPWVRRRGAHLPPLGQGGVLRVTLAALIDRDQGAPESPKRVRSGQPKK
jgi:hypothetical protein